MGESRLERRRKRDGRTALLGEVVEEEAMEGVEEGGEGMRAE